MNFHEEKARLRQQLKQRRNGLSRAEREKKSRQILENLSQIPEFSMARSAFCYLSYLSEVDTHALLERLLDRSARLAVPKIVDKTVMHAVTFSGWDELQPDNMGILTPINDELDNGPFDIALTPGLGFTRQGGRLGYGRGYYDRWFARHTVHTRIGLCFEVQITENLPLEDTDMPLHLLVSEKQVYDFRGMS